VIASRALAALALVAPAACGDLSGAQEESGGQPRTDAGLRDGGICDAAVADARPVPPADAAPLPGWCSFLPPDDSPPFLTLVATRDRIDARVTHRRALALDPTRIYLASADGRLVVLAGDLAAGFPLAQTIHVSDAALTSVGPDPQRVYVTSSDGFVHVFRKDSQLALEFEEDRVRAPSREAQRLGSALLMADGGSAVALAPSFAYVAPFDFGDAAMEFALPSLAPRRRYDPPDEFGRVFAFARETGALLGSVMAPGGADGLDAPPAIDAESDDELAVFQSACCVPGVDLYDPQTFAFVSELPVAAPTAIIQFDRFFLVGTADGALEIWRACDRPNPDGGPLGIPSLFRRLDLRALTGDETLVVRAMEFGYTGLVVLASSEADPHCEKATLLFFDIEVAEP
jgi:hypothetical protein